MKAIKLDKIDRKTKRVIGIRWAFTSYNPHSQRSEKVPKSSIPSHIWNCQNEEVVIEWCKSESAKINSITARIERRLNWEKEFYDFNELVEKFTDYQRPRAPNSWENDVHYLKTYVLNFFLSEKRLNNIYEWKNSFEEFKIWLGQVQPLKAKLKNLSINSQNRAIDALNKFLKYLSKIGKLDWQVRMERNRESEDTSITLKDLYNDDEINNVHFALLNIDERSANLFYVLSKTGLRLNEALGLSLKSTLPGKIGSGDVSNHTHEILRGYGLGEYNGYLIVDSQPAFDCIRNNDERLGPVGKVIRKPLKQRKKIHIKWNRYIPLFDQKAWEIIRSIHNVQFKLKETNCHGTESEDYLLFDGLTRSSFYGHLKKACGKLGIEFRHPHCLRHTFLTWFYGKTSDDRVLAERVAGHSTPRMINRYSHVREQMGEEQERQRRGIAPL